MTPATTVATQNPAQSFKTGDLSGTARGQIEFSLNLLRIASPGDLGAESVSKRPSDVNSARIKRLEELLASLDLVNPSVNPAGASSVQA
jgi:hypothetical protein